MCEKFHDYLYGCKFEVVTDNNPLTYVFTTSKLDATGQRWVAALSDYDFSIKYRSGKKNADADGLSRIPEGTGKQNIIFPEVLKALCLSTTVSQENCPLVESLAFTQIDTDAEMVPVMRWTKQAFSCSKFLNPGGQLWANTAFEGSQFYSIGVPKFYSWVNVISVYVYNDLG